PVELWAPPLEVRLLLSRAGPCSRRSSSMLGASLESRRRGVTGRTAGSAVPLNLLTSTPRKVTGAHCERHHGMPQKATMAVAKRKDLADGVQNMASESRALLALRAGNGSGLAWLKGSIRGARLGGGR